MSDNSRKHAVVIGVDAYPSFFPSSQLAGCVNDAVEIRQFLVEQAGFPAEQARLLLSPGPAAPPALATSAEEATSARIRAALAAVTDAARAGDEVVLYYAGHGVRVSNADTGEWVYAMAPRDTGGSARNFTNLILDRELNAFLRRLTKVGATVTAILDSCHSGGSTRGPLGVETTPGVRQLELSPLSPEEWAAFQAEHAAVPPRTRAPAPFDGDGGALRDGSPVADDDDGAGGWFDRHEDSWIGVSACRESELAAEATYSNPTHGAFTFELLGVLREAAREGRVANLRWHDVAPRVRRAVSGRFKGRQTPTLEGRGERPVFGGAWRPFNPAFTVTVASSGLTLDGGLAQGLEQGAEVAIYPPGTESFAEADAAGARSALATIESASPTSSAAQLVAGSPAVADGSRARLHKPGPRTRPLGVALIDVPAEISGGILAVPDAASFLILNSSDAPADVEVRPWSGACPPWGPDAQGGWVLVARDPAVVVPVADDVIAYLPPVDPQDPDRSAAKVGEALGLGLVHWARYNRVVRLANADASLAAMLQVGLRVGADREAMIAKKGDDTVSPRRLPDAAGVHQVTSAEYLWVELRVKRGLPGGLFAGVLGCSNDGNVKLFWPPPNAEAGLGISATLDEALPPEQAKYVGKDAFTPAHLGVRADQTSSLFVLKVIAYAAPERGEPVNLLSQQLPSTVQDILRSALGWTTRGDFGDVEEPLRIASPRWLTVDLRIRVRRA